MPLHLIGIEPRATEEAVARLVASRAELWEQYSGWLATFHQRAYEGVRSMARTKKEKFEVSLEPLVETMGLDWVIQKLGPDRVIERLGAERIYAALTPRQRKQLKRLLEKGTTSSESP